MNEQTPQRSQQPGQHGKHHDDECPPPCPDPCGKPPWGPPEIRPECCPDDRTCCPPDPRGSCTWDEVDDPCVRAASAECGGKWTKISCKCESSNPDCKCAEWDCGTYPQGTCVPCDPCDGLIPDPEDPGSCEDPERDCCDSEALRDQLDALNRCITSQQGEKSRIDADIAARQERAAKLTALIGKFDGFVTAYKEKRPNLKCREDCLKGFFRDTTAAFGNTYQFPEECLEKLGTAINLELCNLEKARCCLKNLNGKLTGTTKIIWERDNAQQVLTKTTEAFGFLTGLPAWIDTQFKQLETLKDQIIAALNDADPQKRNFAFYLFYWQFVPGLCKRFPVAFCCEEKAEKEGKKDHEQSRSCRDHDDPTRPKGPVHIGCEPGDWHPSSVLPENLQQLICCAWDDVQTKEQAVRDTAAVVAEVERNKTLIETKVTADSASLTTRIQTKVQSIKCFPSERGRQGERHHA